MGFITIPNSFTSSTTAQAVQVNSNFAAVLDGLTDGSKDIKVNTATVETLNVNQTAIVDSFQVTTASTFDKITVKKTAVVDSLQVTTAATFNGNMNLGPVVNTAVVDSLQVTTAATFSDDLFVTNTFIVGGERVEIGPKASALAGEVIVRGDQSITVLFMANGTATAQTNGTVLRTEINNTSISTIAHIQLSGETNASGVIGGLWRGGGSTGPGLFFNNTADSFQLNKTALTTVSEPTGGATIDAEARTAIDDILTRLVNHSFIVTGTT